MTVKKYELIAQAKKKPISLVIYVLFIITLAHFDVKFPKNLMTIQ